jgi:FHA domain
MNSDHVFHKITQESKYLGRKCPIRLQDFRIGDEVIVCQQRGVVFSQEGFNAFIGDWHGRCPYCQNTINVQNIPEESEPQTEYKQRDTDFTEAEFEETGPLGILWVKNGYQRGRLYKVRHGTTIGRKYGDVLLDDPKVSKRHAKLTVDDDQFMLWDFGSTNGTFVNGERIRKATLLRKTM